MMNRDISRAVPMLSSYTPYIFHFLISICGQEDGRFGSTSFAPVLGREWENGL